MVNVTIYSIYMDPMGIDNLDNTIELPGWWFVATPLKNMSSSDWMMTFPTIGKHKKCSKPPNRNACDWTEWNLLNHGSFWPSLYR